MSLAMAYLAFYVANLPLGVSGVTAVVVLGLFGSATGKWQMCAVSHPPFSFVVSTPRCNSVGICNSCILPESKIRQLINVRLHHSALLTPAPGGMSRFETSATLCRHDRRSPQVAESGYFFSFWDTVGYAVNGLVFFFAGASAVNFFIRCGAHLKHHTRKAADTAPWLA